MRKIFRVFAPILLLSLLTGMVFGQSEEVLIFGVVKDPDTNKGIKKGVIRILEDDSVETEYTTGRKGDFRISLEYDHFYEIQFTKSDYVTKMITMDTKNIPAWDREGGFGFDLDITLFKPEEGEDYNEFKKPIAHARYVDDSGMVFEKLEEE